MRHHTSISHFSGREQQALLRLKNKIVELYKPVIIYLIGCDSSSHLSRNCFCDPRNEEKWRFSCDLVIVLPDGKDLSERAFDELKGISNDNEDILIIAHPFGFIKKQIQEYSLFFCWIQRRSIVLYERDNFREKLPKPVQNMKQYEKQVHDFFASNPNYNGYTKVKLSPLPKKYLTAKGQAESSDVDMSSNMTLQNVLWRFLREHGAKGINKPIQQELIRYLRARRRVQDDTPDKFNRILWDCGELMDFFDFVEVEILKRYKKVL